MDQRRQIHPRRIGDPTSGTDFEPRHRRRHLHHHQRHGRTQESRFARTRVRATCARTVFGVEVLNDDKRPILEFGIIRSVIGFEGGKFPKIVFTNFEGWHHIALRLKRKTLPAASLGQVCNGLFEDQQGRWMQGERNLGTNPTGGVANERGLSHLFEPGSYFLAPYEEHTFSNSYETSIRPGSS